MHRTLVLYTIRSASSIVFLVVFQIFFFGVFGNYSRTGSVTFFTENLPVGDGAFSANLAPTDSCNCLILGLKSPTQDNSTFPKHFTFVNDFLDIYKDTGLNSGFLILWFYSHDYDTRSVNGFSKVLVVKVF